MIKLSSKGGKRRVKVSLLSRPGATEVTAAVFAGRRRGQTRTLPIFNLASYHGRQSHPLDADLIKDNKRSRSSRRSVSDSSLLLRCPNKTLSGKWWQCYLGEGFNQCLGFSLSVVTVTVTVDEGGGRRLEWTATHQSWLRPLLPSHWFLQKTHYGENEPEVSSPITFQINFCPLILFKVDVSFVLAPLKPPVCFQHVFGHLIGKWKKEESF